MQLHVKNASKIYRLMALHVGILLIYYALPRTYQNILPGIALPKNDPSPDKLWENFLGVCFDKLGMSRARLLDQPNKACNKLYKRNLSAIRTIFSSRWSNWKKVSMRYWTNHDHSSEQLDDIAGACTQGIVNQLLKPACMLHHAMHLWESYWCPCQLSVQFTVRNLNLW